MGVIIELSNGTTTETLFVDATPVQDHSSPAQATEHPVEQGADPSDHLHRKARTLKLQIIQSDNPGGLSRAGKIVLAQPGRGQELLDKLYLAQQSARLLRVYTSQGVYENMAIEGLDSTRNSGTGKATQVTLSLKQIRIVSTQHVQVKSPKARKRDSGGPQVAQPAKLSERAASVWSQAYHAVVGGKPTGGGR